MRTTGRKFNGLYSLAVWGKNKKLKSGRVTAYGDSAIVLKWGLFGRLDTLQIDDMYTI